MEVRKKFVDGVMSPVGMLCIGCVLLCIGALFHSYWLCRNLVDERTANRTYIETTAKAQNDLLVAAINASTLAIQSQTNFNAEMRRDLDAREAALIRAAEKVEMIALALEQRARDVQKAALMAFRAAEKIALQHE
jgi:hypothetical protein